MRLISTLRDAAKTRNPYAYSADLPWRSSALRTPLPLGARQEDEELGNALADLAVTGRRTYCLRAMPPLTPLHELQVQGAERSHIDLGTSPYTATELVAKVGGLLAPLVSASPTPVGQCRQRRPGSGVHHRLGAPRPGGRRTATRPPRLDGGLGRRRHAAPTDERAGAPLRALNPGDVPATGTHPERTLQTRFLIASPAAPAAGRPPHTVRVLPPDLTPQVPDGNNVILFLHGHVSGVEEALTLIPELHRAGLERGMAFSVISVDLPNCGYSESFDHDSVATVRHLLAVGAHRQRADPHTRAGLHRGLRDRFRRRSRRHHSVQGPLLGSLRRQPRGEPGLRLGRRSPMPAWLDKGIVS